MSQANEIVLYHPDDAVRLEVMLGDETVWLTQTQIAVLFGVKVPAVSRHLKNIFEAGELIEKSVVSILEITASDGKRYKTKNYNLDAIISVGYRINSINATKFRQWATSVLRDYMLQGYAIHGRFERIERRKAASATIYTARISKVLRSDLDKHNEQYPPVAVERISGVHDRFLIIDENVYHIGASVKDLGKKLFAFSRLHITPKNILGGFVVVGKQKADNANVAEDKKMQ